MSGPIEIAKKEKLLFIQPRSFVFPSFFILVFFFSPSGRTNRVYCLYEIIVDDFVHKFVPLCSTHNNIIVGNVLLLLNRRIWFCNNCFFINSIFALIHVHYYTINHIAVIIITYYRNIILFYNAFIFIIILIVRLMN